MSALDWNAIAMSTLTSQPPPGVSPFAQARFMAITQLAVFEAVNAITGDYEPYLGTVVAPAGASADAAAIAAAYRVLKNYFPASARISTPLVRASLAAIPDGPAKSRGIATGEAAAAADDRPARRRRLVAPGVLPARVAGPGRLAAHAKLPCWPVESILQWQNITPFGIPSVRDQAWIERSVRIRRRRSPAASMRRTTTR